MLTTEIWLFPCVTDVKQNRVRIANVSVPWNTRGKCNDFATGQLVSGPLAVFWLVVDRIVTDNFDRHGMVNFGTTHRLLMVSLVGDQGHHGLPPTARDRSVHEVIPR